MQSICSLHDPNVQKVLETLHARAKGDWKIMLKSFPQFLWGILRGKSMMQALTPEMLKDAYIPVSKEQGKLLYSVARSMNAQHIVEFGSSFGLGTLYLAAAAKDNAGKVTTTEIEPFKCQATLQNVADAQLTEYVTLLEGDALQTLQDIEPGIDLVFLDGWKDLYNDVLDIVLPKLRVGSIVIGDNINIGEAKQYFARVSDPSSGFVTTTTNKSTAFSCYMGNT